MALTIHNVRGDGNCYYRCIWNIVKNHDEYANAFYINDADKKTEDDGAQEIREYVALSVKYEQFPKDILINLVEIYKSTPDIISMYPLLQHVDDDLDFDQLVSTVAREIEETNMMASSYEHEIVKARLNSLAYDYIGDLQLIILSKACNVKEDDVAEKWLFELHSALQNTQCDKIALLINEDNIHYKYMKFGRKTIIHRLELENYVDACIATYTDSE